MGGPEPFTEDEAWGALRHVLPDLDRHVSDRSIEMFRAREWYLKGGKFDLGRVTAAWNSKLDGALARGYAGMRVSGNRAWLDKKGLAGLRRIRARAQRIDRPTNP